MRHEKERDGTFGACHIAENQVTDNSHNKKKSMNNQPSSSENSTEFAQASFGGQLV